MEVLKKNNKKQSQYITVMRTQPDDYILCHVMKRRQYFPLEFIR